MNATSTISSDACEMRDVARQIFQHAVEESSIERGFARDFHYERGVLRLGDNVYDLGTFSKVFVVAIGKGAHTSLEALMSRVGTEAGLTGIVCAPTLPAVPVAGFRYFEGGHPVPNEDSFGAARADDHAMAGLTKRKLSPSDFAESSGRAGERRQSRFDRHAVPAALRIPRQHRL